MKFKITTLIFAISFLTAIFFKIDLFLIIFILLIYLIILAYGSSVICSNFYFKSICRINTNEKNIYLTFDDGPNPEYTPKILKMLEDNNASATFFCIGKNIEENKDLARQIAKNNLISNHSYSHSNFFDIFPTKRVIDELEQTNKLIKEITNKENKYFRPPFGVTNPNIAKALKKTNLTSIGWSFRSFDTTNKSAKSIFKDFKTKVKPGDIILLHDNNSKTIELLQYIIDYSNENNFKITSIEKN